MTPNYWIGLTFTHSVNVIILTLIWQNAVVWWWHYENEKHRREWVDDKLELQDADE